MAQGNPSLSSSEIVVLKVVDKNQPTFAHFLYTVKVSEAATPGTVVTNIRAHSGSGGVLHYRIIEGDSRRRFAVDSTTGQISVNSELDWEFQSNYSLIVEAIDVTRQNISSTCKVDILIGNVNDSPPIFLHAPYNFTTLESTPVGSLLGQVQAVDPDTTGQLFYSIIEGEKSSGFIAISILALLSNTM